MEREELLTEIATLYYYDKLNQREIAKRFGISRSNVSRLLTEARNRGIVEIKVKQKIPLDYDLQKEIKGRFSLKDVRILKSSGLNYKEMLKKLGIIAASYLKTILERVSIIGMSWGTAIYEVVNAFESEFYQNIEVIQMIGGIGAENPDIDGTELARRLAKKVGGRYRYLHAPLIVENADIKKSIMMEKNVKEALQKVKKADVAIVGIGSTDPTISSLVRSGYLNKKELNEIRKLGAVGDICAKHFDINGNICQIDLNERVIGIDTDVLKDINYVIGVAGGKAKASAILGVLRGGYINVLISDDQAIRDLLRLSE
jgi:DNA-binding transcriptional regulator LsrR (DeoR family)